MVLIADKVKDLNLEEDFKQLSETLDTQHQLFKHKKDDFEENMKSLKKSYQNNSGRNQCFTKGNYCFF